ncbi:hypothetical protein ACVWWK_002216 [Bradyrhizobium sp. LB9.1b]
MTGLSRYAIYFAAGSNSALSRFGAELLGYDAHTGNELPFPNDTLHAAPDWRDITADPRKYGFHGTLKAPMALAPGKTEAELLAACATFADEARTIPVIRPIVDSISGFIAVTPAEPVDALQELAADCVRAFDSFRPAMTAEDRGRREAREAQRAAARLSRSLGLSLRDGGISLPHDADGAAGRGAPRPDSGDAAGKVCCARSQHASDRSRRAVQAG